MPEVSRIYETRHQPAKDYQECVGVKCDLCGAEAPQAGLTEWGSGSYEVNETEVKVTVKARQGESYPDNGTSTEYRVDLCPRCFVDELVPWLRSRGAVVDVKEFQW